MNVTDNQRSTIVLPILAEAAEGVPHRNGPTSKEGMCGFRWCFQYYGKSFVVVYADNASSDELLTEGKR